MKRFFYLINRITSTATIIKIMIIFFSNFGSQSFACSDSDHGCIILKSKALGECGLVYQRNFDLNGVHYDFIRDTKQDILGSNGNLLAGSWQAKVNREYLLIDSPNIFTYTLSNHCYSPIEREVIWHRPKNQGSLVICRFIAKARTEKQSNQCPISLTLKELDPDMYEALEKLEQEVEKLKEKNKELMMELDILSNSALELYEQFETKLSHLENDLALIDRDHIEDIDPHTWKELSQDVYGVKQLLADIQKDISTLKEEVAEEITTHAEKIKEFKNELKKDFKFSEQIIQDIDLEVDYDIPSIQFPPAKETTSFDLESYKSYNRQADNIIHQLNTAYIHHHRSEFLMIMAAWIKNQEKSRDEVMRAGVSLAIQQAFIAAEKRVFAYKDYVLDSYGFFKDSKIKDHYKRMIHESLEPLNTQLTDHFKDELNTWNKALNSAQQSVLDSTGEIAKTFDRLKNIHATNESQKIAKDLALTALEGGFESLTAAARIHDHEVQFKEVKEETDAYIEAGKSLADIALSLTPGVGIGKDLYELLLGKNLVTQEELTKFDRTFAFVGIISMGGSHWLSAGAKVVKGLMGKALGKGLKVISQGSEVIFGDGRKIFDSAAKLGIKGQEKLQPFMEFISKVTGKNPERFEQVNKAINEVGELASNPVTRENLWKQIASEAQMAEKGTIIAGEGTETAFRNAEYAAKTYGGEAADYVKKTSSSIISPDNKSISTHWIENIKNGQRYEAKTIYEETLR